MKLLISFLHLFLFFSADAQTNIYIDHPSNKDTLCIKDVALARKDVSAGILKYCAGSEWHYPQARMFDELDSLCKSYGIIFSPDTGVERDVEFVGDPNTYTCYRDFMDREVAKRFGSDFKSKLMKQADSIWISKSLRDTIISKVCDVEPRSFHGWDNEFFSTYHFPDTCAMLTTCKNCYFIVDFIVDTTGLASDFKFIYGSYFPLAPDCRKIYEKSILRTFDLICDNKCWVPGQLANRKVTSELRYVIDLINHDIK